MRKICLTTIIAIAKTGATSQGTSACAGISVRRNTKFFCSKSRTYIYSSRGERWGFAIVVTEKTSTKESPSARIGANNLQILHLRTFQFTRSSTNIKILISI